MVTENRPPTPTARAFASTWVLVLACVISTACTVAGAPDAVTTPGPGRGPGRPTLSGWKLTLPVAGPKGNAATVEPAAVTPPWLTSESNGDVTLWAPVRGTTTPNSDHARTELVSHTPFRAGMVHRQLTASVTVTQVPHDKADVIIGQIHGALDMSSIPFAMVHYAAGAIGVVVKQAPTSAVAVHLPLLNRVALGSPFEFSIVDRGDGTLTFTATAAGHQSTQSTAVPTSFAGHNVRFQTGAYQQADSTGAADANDGARMTFHGLTSS